MSNSNWHEATHARPAVGGSELAALVEAIDVVVFALEETIEAAKALSARATVMREALVKASL